MLGGSITYFALINNQKLGSCIATADANETQKYCLIIKRLLESNLQAYIPSES